jgi:hypothetical protein
MKEIKPKYFPCPICKGEGEWVEPVLEDGSGPSDWCNYCEKEGMIEIRGKVHRQVKAEKIALEIIHFMQPDKTEWTWQELDELGNKALDLVLSKSQI